MMTLENGRPKDETGRLEKEIRVYDLLDRLHVEYQRVDHEAAKTEYYLLLIREDKKFRTAEVSKQIGSTRLSFAGPDKMSELLDITPGSVSVMGLMNDHDHLVKLLIDEDIMKSEYFGCHPCVNTSSLRLKTEDLLGKILPKLGYTYTGVRIKGEL